MQQLWISICTDVCHAMLLTEVTILCVVQSPCEGIVFWHVCELQEITETHAHQSDIKFGTNLTGALWLRDAFENEIEHMKTMINTYSHLHWCGKFRKEKNLHSQTSRWNKCWPSSREAPFCCSSQGLWSYSCIWWSSRWHLELRYHDQTNQTSHCTLPTHRLI